LFILTAYEVKIDLTGNPFVDTGLAVLATLANCKGVDELTLDHMTRVHRNGEQLARWNSKLKSTSMIFTINSLATHPGIKDYEKRVLYYSKMTTGILNKIGREDIKERCESCGHNYSLDIDKLAREILVPLGNKDVKRYVGRDWFPLAGSIGSDAQALPASSRAPNICAKCMFAVHYLPLGVLLINGRLAVFQSMSTSFWYDCVRSITEEVRRRVSAGDTSTLGAKEGSIAAIKRILSVMEEMYKDELPAGTSLFVWRFSNSGTGPDCEIREIPGPALVFLQKAVQHGCRNEIENLIAKDRNPEYSLLNCISKGTDYFSLYPFRKFGGASPKLFFLYQTSIRRVSSTTLRVAYKIAEYTNSQLNRKEFESLRKDIDKDFAKQNALRRIIVTMVENKVLSFGEYMELFSADSNASVRISRDAWKFVRYYMHHVGEFYETDEPSINTHYENNERLSHTGAVIFDSIANDKGIEKFRQMVLEPLAHGKLGLPWLRRQFVKNAEKYEGFTYEDWKSLCLNEQGKESVFELLFRFRLMWTEWIDKGSAPEIKKSAPIAKARDLETDLLPEHKDLLARMMNDYISRKGISRFQKYVLEELKRGEKGLFWFRRQLSLFQKQFEDDEVWDKFLKDSNGNSIKTLRLFQLSLYLANSYRELLFKEQLQTLRQ
jgi:hypothetical protein